MFLNVKKKKIQKSRISTCFFIEHFIKLPARLLLSYYLSLYYSMHLPEILSSFVKDVGLEVSYEPIETKTFLPGILVRRGGLVIDKKKLLYPGDILHEAGHLAVMPLSIRQNMNNDLGNDDIQKGGEMMAIAWSYAACIYLNIDPYIVFHEQGYRGGGKDLVKNFEKGNILGLPLLQWQGMSYGVKEAERLKVQPFPHMVQWLCIRDNYTTKKEEEHPAVA